MAVEQIKMYSGTTVPKVKKKNIYIYIYIYIYSLYIYSKKKKEEKIVSEASPTGRTQQKTSSSKVLPIELKVLPVELNKKWAVAKSYR